MGLHQEESDELTKLRDKVKNATSASQQHARDAKAMEARAIMLASEVDRVKNMLMVSFVLAPVASGWVLIGGGCVDDRRPEARWHT
jgi:hypothetical protein